jgi:hypothetical protein
VYPAARNAPSARVFGGSTRTSATATVAATVVWPLGRLLPAAARSMSTPRFGRTMISFSTWVVAFAPAISSSTMSASARRRRISAMNTSTAAATAMEATDIALRTVPTSSSMRAWPMELPVSATVSSFWPCSVRTKNRANARKASRHAAPTASCHAATIAVHLPRMGRR